MAMGAIRAQEKGLAPRLPRNSASLGATCSMVTTLSQRLRFQILFDFDIHVECVS